MDASQFRSRRRSSSSFSRPVHRSRSLSSLSTSRSQKGSVDHMSGIRDYDLKKDIEAKVVMNLMLWFVTLSC